PTSPGGRPEPAPSVVRTVRSRLRISMTDSQDLGSKRSIARLRRLGPMLDAQLDDPVAALELLVAEAESGELHPELWEQLHAAAARDDKLIELGTAYEQLARGRRFRPLPTGTQ